MFSAFQSTFPRGERRRKFRKEALRSYISIHVPSWGTTTAITNMFHDFIFQSTFPRGERLNTLATVSLILVFQSTFPRGERHILEHKHTYYVFISIHVPSWGTTIKQFEAVTGQIRFQSTFPRGERQRIWLSRISYTDFNPRSLVGNDKMNFKSNAKYKISIHVPSWGTTANFHKYSLFFYAINIIFLLFIIPSLFSLVLFMLLF